MLEPSHEQAQRDPVMPERLEQPTSAPPEEVDRAVEGIGAERLLHQRGQPVHPGPHVRHATGQVDPRARRRPDHRARTADSTRRSAASSMSRPTRTVVPQGKARVRVQVSAAHSREDLEFAVEAFTAVRDELGVA